MDECLELIKKYTNKKYAALTSRGNAAIDRALEMIQPKTTILIPDQGGWIHFQKAPPRFGFKLKKLTTDYGIIDPKDCKDAAAILFHMYAGYFAQQPGEEIYKLCKKNNIKVIADVSANLSEKISADIIVGSCKKLIGYDKFGFIASDNEVGETLKGTPELVELLKKVPNKLKQLQQKQVQVKKDLAKFHIYHKDKIGIAVAVAYDESILTYAKQHNLKAIRCPKNIKIEADAIVLDLL